MGQRPVTCFEEDYVMALKKLHKVLRWVIVLQILWSATSIWEATIVAGVAGIVIAVLYCKFIDWFYRGMVEVG
jgi:hypothetical protein